ncbi:unnamed protein product [Closterium sp. NIES-53]
MLGTAANRGWRIKQMDITTAFLNGIILEELYMVQPEGLDDWSGRVCRLKKAIYGPKQAPRAWYHKLEETLLAEGFKKSECDHSLFLLQEKEQFLMLLVYVDDIVLFSESAAMIERVEEMLEMQFKCSKMGDVKYYLGMHVERDLDEGVLRLHQRKYCEGLAEKYGLQGVGKPATPLTSGFTVEPCADEEVSKLDRVMYMYLPDYFNDGTGRVCKLLKILYGLKLSPLLWYRALDGVLLSAGWKKSQVDTALYFKVGDDKVTCWVLVYNRTSTSGYVFVSGGAAVCWSSQRIECATLSSTKSESATEAGKEGRCLRFLLTEFRQLDAGTTTVLQVDNKSAITVAEGMGLTGKLKHMEPRQAWLRHMVKRGKFSLRYIPRAEQPADFLTKALHYPAFNRCSVAIGQVRLVDVGDGKNNVQE